MKMLDSNEKLSVIDVTEGNIVSLVYRIDNNWLDLPLAPFSQKLQELFSGIRDCIDFEDAYYHIILEDECDDIEETMDFADMYVVELLEVLLRGGDQKFSSERWGIKNEAWDALNLTEILKRRLLNYESMIRYFNITILGKDGEVAYRLLED